MSSLENQNQSDNESSDDEESVNIYKKMKMNEFKKFIIPKELDLFFTPSDKKVHYNELKNTILSKLRAETARYDAVRYITGKHFSH